MRVEDVLWTFQCQTPLFQRAVPNVLVRSVSLYSLDRIWPALSFILVYIIVSCFVFCGWLCPLRRERGAALISFTQFAIHLFINISMIWLKEMGGYSACLKGSRQMLSQKERTLNEVWIKFKKFYLHVMVLRFAAISAPILAPVFHSCKALLDN